MGSINKMSTGSASKLRFQNASKKLVKRVDSEVREAFNLFDKDGDGKITRVEIEELVQNLGGDTSCPHLQELLNASDVLGSVEVGQFMNLWQKFKHAANKDEITQVIKEMDFVGDVEKEVNRCLADMDVDGNGSVSYAEFMVKWKMT